MLPSETAAQIAAAAVSAYGVSADVTHDVGAKLTWGVNEM